MSGKVDIQEISNALLASAEREEELLMKNASLQKEIDALKEAKATIPFVEPVTEPVFTEPNNTEVTDEEVTLSKEASSYFDPYDMGQIATPEEPEMFSSATDRLSSWLDEI